MEIIFKKGNDKNSITCKRSDGSNTWMEASAFMVAHDLTHYVIERTLELKSGFYGLLELGFDIADFEKKLKITPKQLPAEAIKTELLVNLILTERNDKTELDDFNSTFNSSAGQLGILKEEFDRNHLNRIRNHLNELLFRWGKLPVNETLVLKW